MKDTIVFAFGRCNPPTSGHAKLVKAVMTQAKKHNADHAVWVSKSQDAKKNPLDAKTKAKFLQKMVPGSTVKPADETIRTFIEVAKNYSGKYKNLVMVAGSDRLEEYKKLLDKYSGKEFDFEKVEVVSAGERDPDAEGVTGISGTKMREYAKNNDIKSFKSGTENPSDKEATDLMKAVRVGMKLESTEEKEMNILEAYKKKCTCDNTKETTVRSFNTYVDPNKDSNDAENMGTGEEMGEAKKDPCWKGYKQLGMKDKDGKKVPNCVPVEEAKVQHKMVVGQKVIHAKNGEGTIKDIVSDPDGGKQEMFSVKFNNGKSQLHYGEELKIKSVAGDLDESAKELSEGMSVEQVEKYIGIKHTASGVIDVYYSGQHFVRVFETETGFTWSSVHQFCKIVLGINQHNEVPYTFDMFETEAEAVVDAIEMFHELGAFKEVDFDITTESMKEPETTKDKTDMKLPAPVKGGKLHGEIPSGYKADSKRKSGLYGSMKEEMTDAQMTKREKIVKSMKKSKSDFENRYGKDAKSVMYATATKMAMKEETEQVDEISISVSAVKKLMGDTQSKAAAVEKVMKAFKVSKEVAEKYVDQVIDQVDENKRFSYNKAEFKDWTKKKEAERKERAKTTFDLKYHSEFKGDKNQPTKQMKEDSTNE